MGEKEYKEAVTEKNYVTHINHITILGDGIINFNRSIKPKFDKTFEIRTGKVFRQKTSRGFRQKICCTILTLLYNNRILKL